MRVVEDIFVWVSRKVAYRLLNPNLDCWTQVTEQETMGAGESLGYMVTCSTSDRLLEVL